MAANDIPLDVRDSLARLTRRGDRSPPAVFVGREAELDLFESATKGVMEGARGHTVVVQGVPGAGKTALLDEYAARLLAANGNDSPPVVPVPLRPSDLNKSALAIIQEVDRQFGKADASKEWAAMVNRMVCGTTFIANTLLAMITTPRLAVPGAP